MGLDVASAGGGGGGAGWRGWRPDCGPRQVLAARQLGIVKIPVMVAAGWTEAQKRAYVLADNQLAITGSGWDPELLRLELGELKVGGLCFSLTGFGDLRAPRAAARHRRDPGDGRRGLDRGAKAGLRAG